MMRSFSLRPFLTAFLLLALEGAAAPQAPSPSPAPGAPQFPAGVELVSVDVVVLDKEGQPVSDLTAADFSVQEDGAAQSLASFEAIRFEEGAPSFSLPPLFVTSNQEERVRPDRSFTVVYDDVHLTAAGAKRAQDELQKLLEKMAAGDVVTIVPTSGGPWWTARLPEGREDLRAFLAVLKPQQVRDQGAGRIADWEAMQIHYRRDPQVLGIVARRWYENGLIAETTPRDPSIRQDRDVDPGVALIRAKATEIYTLASQRAAVSLDVLERVASSLAAGRGRKTVLVVSEGFLYDSTRREFRDLVRAARESNAVLYFFDARGRLGADPPANEAEFGRPIEERDRLAIVQNFSHDAEGSESVALDTGGRAFKGTDDLASGMEKVVRESRSYYLLGYVSSNSRRDGKYRKLKVTVSRSGLEVRARPGYFASSDEDRRKPDPKALDPRVRAGLDSPLVSDGIPLRLASYVLGSGASGNTTAVLVADVDVRPVPFEAKGGRMIAALDTFVVVTPRDGGENRRQEKRLDLALPPDLLQRLKRDGLPLLRDFELPPGTYQARLLVRDPRGAKLGTVRHTFTVPLAKGLRTSTPFLTDAVQNEGGRELPVPLARRHFASGSRLYYVFDVYGASPAAEGGPGEVRIGYAVRRGDKTFAESAPRAIVAAADGSLSQKLVLPLTGAEPGMYEIRLLVTDPRTGTTLERRDAFLVDTP